MTFEKPILAPVFNVVQHTIVCAKNSILTIHANGCLFDVRGLTFIFRDLATIVLQSDN